MSILFIGSEFFKGGTGTRIEESWSSSPLRRFCRSGFNKPVYDVPHNGLATTNVIGNSAIRIIPFKAINYG
jgi:hypothetical protein